MPSPRNASRPTPARPSASAGRSFMPWKAPSVPRFEHRHRTSCCGWRSAWPPSPRGRCACSRCHASRSPCPATLSAPGSCCASSRATPTTGSAWTRSHRSTPRACSPSASGGRSWSSWPTPIDAWSAGSSDPRSRASPTSYRAPGRPCSTLVRPLTSSRSCWAMQTIRCRRRSRGRSGNGAASIVPRWGSGWTGNRCWPRRPATVIAPGSSVTPSRPNRPGRRRRSASASPAYRGPRTVHQRGDSGRTAVRTGRTHRPGHRTTG